MTTLVHGTCVAVGGSGVLLLGPSASGKSDLALRLIDAGAKLVADDQVSVSLAGDGLIARAPKPLPKVLEVRGLGLMPVPMAAEIGLVVVFDLAPGAIERLPKPATWACEGRTLPLHRLDAFAASAPAKVRIALSAALQPHGVR